jgi:CDP-diacylglycerol--glycerol-3-phosphate 3-phosphatidyltransferase
MGWSNFLTWLRIALIPLLIVVHWLPALPEWWRGALAAIVFAGAALTDFWDGWLARRLNQETRFGAFLDPIADKLLVACALILVIVAESDFLLRASLGAAAIVIIGREICISALREWMALIGASHAVAVNIVGKWKTAAQMSAIIMLLFKAPLGPFPTAVVGHVLIWLAALMTLWSMLVYLRGAWRHLRRGESERR